MKEVLIVEDDKIMCSTLQDLLSQKQLTSICCNSLKVARDLIRSENRNVNLVLLDINLPDGSGFDIISELKAIPSLPEIIIITGQGDKNGAELAIKSGAWAYLPKTMLHKELMPLIVASLEYRKEKLVNRNDSEGFREATGIIGSCGQIKTCINLAKEASCSDFNVLIEGESGTGKEVFARAIHNNSSRRDGKLIVVDCTALPESLAESILFGHAKGAFTGAINSSPGLISQADKGTLFLDELGELPKRLQKIFLRVLQDNRFRPVGQTEELHSDFRVIAATNRNLMKMVEKGKFRKDLYYRLQTVNIHLPPLRDRGSDVIQLAHFFAEMIHGPSGNYKRIKFSHDFVEALKTYPWPGNVRELYHAMETSLAASKKYTTLFSQHLPEKIRIKLAQDDFNASEKNEATRDVPDHLIKWKNYKEETERKYLDALLSQTNRNISEACKISGFSRSRLYQLIDKHYPKQNGRFG